uniref:Uncharacterized protein n=1 Tax=Cryptomonas curvata TaxID=233186 RepID=A0A6T8EPR1_9CRYP|mmetsp:Transcript_8659/g.18642  ORF Transcript_8659/g.18642 Transcript_8659/m.18642 type:complete len:154 (+) Transcript_8659:200-661(+)
MNRRLASVLSWLDSLCMAAEKMKTVELAAARSRISEWPSEDTTINAGQDRLQGTGKISFFDLAGLDYSVLRDMNAVQRRRRCWEAVNSRTDIRGATKVCYSSANSPLLASTSVVPAAAATPRHAQPCADCNPSAALPARLPAAVLHFNSSQQG